MSVVPQRPTRTELKDAVTVFTHIFLTREPIASPGRFVEVFDRATLVLLAEHHHRPSSPIGQAIAELFDANAARNTTLLRQTLSRLAGLVEHEPPAHLASHRHHRRQQTHRRTR